MRNLSILKKLALFALLAVLALLALAASRPDTCVVARSAHVAAPPAVVYAILADPKQGVRWSVFEMNDPNIQRSFSGPESGVGMVYHWRGEEAGEGEMTVTELVPNERVDLRMDFIRPMACTNQVRFAVAGEGEGTQVTWTMSGEVPFFAKLAGLVVDTDKMVGESFEKSLTNLDVFARAQAQPANPTAPPPEPPPAP